MKQLHRRFSHFPSTVVFFGHISIDNLDLGSGRMPTSNGGQPSTVTYQRRKKRRCRQHERKWRGPTVPLPHCSEVTQATPLRALLHLGNVHELGYLTFTDWPLDVKAMVTSSNTRSAPSAPGTRHGNFASSGKNAREWWLSSILNRSSRCREAAVSPLLRTAYAISYLSDTPALPVFSALETLIER